MELLERIKNFFEFLRMNQPLLTALGAVFAIILAFISLSERARNIFRRAWHLVTRHRSRVPRETIRVLAHPSESWWAMGSERGQPAMQVVSHLYITNIIDVPIRVIGARIVRPRRARINGFVMVQHSEHNIFGGYPILPMATTEASADFWIRPPVRKEGQDLKATIALIDQFGNEHQVKNVVFKGQQPRESRKVEPTGESIHAIADPVEKEIVAVLKAELHRYKICGRLAGGLGSVQTIYKGRSMIGVGSDARTLFTARNQSIIPDPEEASIESDNATALLNLYQRLRDDEGGNDQQRLRFVTALLERLSRSTDYASVGYLILLVLFRIGRLSEALDTAKKNLQKDEAYGFSDLLRFEYQSFTLELLDQIEKLVESIEENTFNIQERIAAIRAFRLAACK